MSTRALETALSHHPESEQALLGGLLIAPNLVADVHGVLTPADFYDPKHAAIFESMLRLSDEGHPIEMASVATDLRNFGELDKVGGLAYLMACQRLGSPHSCMYYAQEVLDAATRRRVSTFHISGLNKAQDGSGTTGKSLITQAIADLDALAEERAISATGAIGASFDETLDAIQTMGAADGGVTGLSTGFHDLDRMTYGLHPGQMITIAARPGAGKALALDTPIPTPDGWTTMGDLAVGDHVLGLDGTPTRIRAATHVLHERPCYQVRFASGQMIVADAQHQWATGANGTRVLTTEQIARHLDSTAQPVDLPAVAPLCLPQHDLPIAPFTLGVLLAACAPGQRTVANLSAETIAHIEDDGYVLKPAGDNTHVIMLPSETSTPDASHDTRGCHVCGEPLTPTARHDITCGLDCSARLAHRESRGLGAPISPTMFDLLADLHLGDHNRIPMLYLRADARARRALWQGLHATAYGLDHLHDAIEALARTLGRTSLGNATGGHRIIDVQPVPSVPVRCIEVDNDNHLFLAGEHLVPTHNSTLGMDLVRACAFKQNRPAAFFSLEMSRQEIIMRLLSAQAGVDLGRMRSGRLDDRDWERVGAKADLFRTAPLYVDDTPGLTMGAIRAQARRLHQRQGLSLIVIDYLQLLSPDTRANSRQEEVSAMSRQVKLLAKELQVPVIAMSQLNRGNEQRSDPTPKISDLRESGAIEQDSDVVILIHREDMYDPDTPRVGESDLILAKQRSAPTGTCVLAFQGAYARFVDLAS